MAFERQVLPVSVEVTPLQKREAALQIDQFVDWAEHEPGTAYDPDNKLRIMSVRNDRAVTKSSGAVESYNMAELQFYSSAYADLTEHHEEQARSSLNWLNQFHHELRIEEIKEMSPRSDSFVTAKVRWNITSEEARILPRTDLSPPNDTPGELAVCLYDREPGAHSRERYIAKVLLFNGLGGDEMIFPYGVAGIYQINEIDKA